MKKLKNICSKKVKRRKKSIATTGKMKHCVGLYKSKKSNFKKRNTQLRLNMNCLSKFNIRNKNKSFYCSIIGSMIIFGIIFIIFGPYFKIKNINILKKDNLTSINIAYKAINNMRGKPIFSIKEKDIYNQLKTYQQNIKDIHLHTTPHSLKITIESYKGLFNTKINKKQYIITENGTFVPNKPDTELKFLHIIHTHQNSINKFLDYKQVLKTKYVTNISRLINGITQNITNIKIEKLTYYITEKELHIKTSNNLLLFSLSEDIEKQIEKTVIFDKQYYALDQYDIQYTDLRVANKIFYCPKEESYQCTKNIKRIYE